MTYRAKVAVLDDERDMLENCRRILSRWGHEPIVFPDPLKAAEIVQNERPDVFITDIRMPNKSGLEVLSEVKELAPNMPVIIFTAYASVESAIDAIKGGAFDYIVKPFTLDGFKIVLDRALEHQRLQRENDELRKQVSDAFRLDSILGVSGQMKKLGDLLQKVSRTDANVLIQGESGTGKELIARCIQVNSNRNSKPFVPVDCAAIPETLLESELFGYQRGAFTGAVQNKPGLFETANGGTLFFDEIGEMPISIQSKLLRVLQERTFRRLGGNEMRKVDVRVVAATNRDLDVERKAGRFREDLFFRLSVVTIPVPPLRDRTGDIPLLAEHFAREFAKRSGIKFTRISRAAMEYLENYTWPGNVRELQNVMERGITLSAGDVITPEELPDMVRDREVIAVDRLAKDMDFKQAKEHCIEVFEKQYLLNLLENCHFNISKVAKLSGLNRRTIYRLMDKHKIRHRRDDSQTPVPADEIVTSGTIVEP
jgi:DNA-binding NtrC family response regulator